MRYSNWDMEHCRTMSGDNSVRSEGLSLGPCKVWWGEKPIGDICIAKSDVKYHNEYTRSSVSAPDHSFV